MAIAIGMSTMRARVELATRSRRSRRSGCVLDAGVDDERHDERDGTRISANESAPSVVEEVARVASPVSGIRRAVTMPMATTTTKADEGGDPANEHGLDPPLMSMRWRQLYGAPTARPRRATELGLHAFGSMRGGDRDGRPVIGLRAVEAAGQVGIGAGVAGERLADGLGDQVRAQERADQRDRVVQVRAVDSIGLLVEAHVEAHRVAHDAGKVRVGQRRAGPPCVKMTSCVASSGKMRWSAPARRQSLGRLGVDAGVPLAGLGRVAALLERAAHPDHLARRAGGGRRPADSRPPGW